MRKHNPIMDRETLLRSLSKAGRKNQPFTPIQAFDMPFDEHRIPQAPLLVNADRPAVASVGPTAPTAGRTN